jgi:hypothetical protein
MAVARMISMTALLMTPELIAEPSPYDLNDGITYDTGTHSGANGQGVLTVSGKNWSTNQWAGYSIHNTTTKKISYVLSNTANTITMLLINNYTPAISWNTGDSFKILRATACLDQVGRGQGGLISGWPPVPLAWPNQALEPMYAWNNTFNGVKGGIADKIEVSYGVHIKEGREIFSGTAMPGYTPYVYPHPLVSGSPAPAPSVDSTPPTISITSPVNGTTVSRSR